MRIGSAIGSATRHTIGMLAQAFLIVAIIATVVIGAAAALGSGPSGADSVFAAKGGNAIVVTLSLAGTSSRLATSGDAVSSGDATFAVTRSQANDEVMWVTNKCFDATGAEVSRNDYPVAWGMWYSLEGTAGPFATSGTNCTAYATWKPWTDRAITGTSLTYGVGS